ncbi:hypothetical protein HAX54_004075, partial [Datura stramonium]|nr:hypothetical protein [Datura stramonium]
EYEQNNRDMNFNDWFFHRIVQMRKEGNTLASCGLYSLARGPFDGVQKFKSHSTYFTGGAISEDTFQQDACNAFLHAFEEDDDFIHWGRNDLDAISTGVTLADDIIRDIKSEPETDNEDLLL